jgi:hypothetical protein
MASRVVFFLIVVTVVVGTWLGGSPARNSVENARPAVVADRRIEVSTDGTTFRTVAEGAYYRTSDGRIRVEEIHLGVSGKSAKQITLILPEAGNVTLYSLSEDTLQGNRHTVRRPKPTDPASSKRWRVKHFQDLGSRSIEGLTCQGFRYGPAPIASHYDVWRCANGTLDVETIYYKPNAKVEREILFNIRFSEPPAYLFEVPASFTIADHSHAAGDHECSSCDPKANSSPAQQKSN